MPTPPRGLPPASSDTRDNAVRLLTKPVWRAGRGRVLLVGAWIAVYQDPEPADQPAFLAEMNDGGGGSTCARRPTFEQTRDYARAMFDSYAVTLTPWWQRRSGWGCRSRRMARRPLVPPTGQ